MDTTFSGTGNSPPKTAARQFTIALLVITGLALAVRLIHVNAPILGYQSWRQADTAAIARNFYRNGFHFLSPQIDWGGWSDGRVECELPIYPFVVAMLYKVFGLSEWVGRALSALAGALTVWIFGQLVRRESDEKTALWAAVLFSFLPLAVYFTRTFQPESTMVCALVAGVFAFSVWSDGGRMRWLILSGVLISLACLIKIFNLYIGLPLVFLAWRRFGRATFRQWSLWLYAALIFVPLVLWYRHAHHIFIETGLSFNIW